jgi:hypothetical protein
VPALALWPFVGPRLARVGLLAPLPTALGTAAVPVGGIRRRPSAFRPPMRVAGIGARPGPLHMKDAASSARPGIRRAARTGASALPCPPGPVARGVRGAGRRVLLRRLARPLVRGWLRFTGDY